MKKSPESVIVKVQKASAVITQLVCEISDQLNEFPVSYIDFCDPGPSKV